MLHKTIHQPLRIGIDAQEANVLNRVGSNMYAFELIHAIWLKTKNDPRYKFVLFHTHPLTDDMPPEREGWEYCRITPAFLSTQWSLPLMLHKHTMKLDVFFSPGHYAPRFSPIPYVSCVMDLAYLKYPKQFKKKDFLQLKHWTGYSIKRAKQVIAISESTKKDIQSYYKIPARKISIVYPALPTTQIELHTTVEEEEKILKKYFLKKPYILYVGTLQPRKNLERLIDAYEKMYFRGVSSFEKLQKKNSKRKQPAAFHLQLILAGKTGWLSKPIIRRIHQSPLKQYIVMTGYITEAEKRVLYKHALCSALVGLYEGFGMPVLESLYYKTVPVISKTSSLPEVGGDAAIYVNPEDSTSIARGLEQASHLNQKEKKQFDKAARLQLKQFSWLDSAEKVLEILERIA